ncbi:MAG: hypothetical protein LHV68_06865 [Elusimicrobia bacterium]|nr:hypothetical protein [Candidatus Liberimonas magnetica]
MLNFEKAENMFYEVLGDLESYLGGLTLVGGWLPYVYTKYLWKNINAKIVTTIDIDFGVSSDVEHSHRDTIFKKLSAMGYSERHLKIGKLYPIVLYKDKIIPIDFIAAQDINIKSVEKYLGREIYLNKLDNFAFLLNNKIVVDVKDKRGALYKLNCAKPSAFLYHKCKTFIQRDSEQKIAKDLYYAYFVLRYSPDIDAVIKDILNYSKKDADLPKLVENIGKYFGSKTSKGCLLVENENGADMFVEDVRQDIYDRFTELIKLLNNQ